MFTAIRTQVNACRLTVEPSPHGPNDIHHEDAEYIREAADAEGVELPEAWQIAEGAEE